MTGRALALKDGETALSDSFVVVEWTADATEGDDPFPIAPLHVHHGDDEAWYVLSGRLGFHFDSEIIEAGPGEIAVATAGTVHTYWNAAAEPTRYLLIMTPTIHDLIRALHDEDLRAGRTMAQVFADHNSSLVDGPPSG